MRKNNDITVRRLFDAYGIQNHLGGGDPQVSYASVPYIDQPTPLAAMQGNEIWLDTPDAHRRLYFAVQSDAGHLSWAADTTVEIASVENFRDMGGYLTADGGTVRWGRFFRSGALRGFTDDELQVYEGMQIKSIFDYRATGEATAAPDVVGPQTKYHAVPAFDETSSSLADMDMEKHLLRIKTQADVEEMTRVFLSLYETLPFGNSAYQQMLDTLDDEHALPMIQHCSAGKDRTGVGCALLLLALGVDAQTVLEDYLLSAIYRKHVNAKYIAAMKAQGLGEHAVAVASQMLTVTPQMLTSSFDAILARYPSFDAFLEAEYGVTAARRAAWREMHTVEGPHA